MLSIQFRADTEQGVLCCPVPHQHPYTHTFRWLLRGLRFTGQFDRLAMMPDVKKSK